MSCDGVDFVGISAKPNPPLPATHSESTRAVALCSFNPNGLDGVTDGVGYVDMTGTLYYAGTSPIPIKIKFTSAKIGGGYLVEDPEQKLVIKGTFKVTLK
jgi:hypothetical protein